MIDLVGLSIVDFFRKAGVRPTRQRIKLFGILFDQGDRHFTAESLYSEALDVDVNISLATIYNTLHCFKEIGMIKEIAIDGSKVYFDTNVSDHHHFYHENSGVIYDIENDILDIVGLPIPPKETEIYSVDIIVRLRNIDEKP